MEDQRIPRKSPRPKRSNIGWAAANPLLRFLVFLEFLVFFPCEEFLVFLSVFPFFSRDFRGSAGIKNPCFFWRFSWPFSKNKERKDREWGCNKWGLKGCLAALPGNRPKSAFFAPFSAFFALFRRVRRAPGKSRKGGKRPSSSDILGFA